MILTFAYNIADTNVIEMVGTETLSAVYYCHGTYDTNAICGCLLWHPNGNAQGEPPAMEVNIQHDSALPVMEKMTLILYMASGPGHPDNTGQSTCHGSQLPA